MVLIPKSVIVPTRRLLKTLTYNIVCFSGLKILPPHTSPGTGPFLGSPRDVPAEAPERGAQAP